MSESQRRMSLFALVVVPYIKLKLDRLYEYMNEEQQLGSTSSEILSTYQTHLKEFFLKAYPYVHFAWESLILFYQLLYLFKYSKFYSPLHRLAGVQLVQLTKEDLESNKLHPPSNRVMKLIAFVIGLLAQAVPVGVFFLKFLNWWHSDEHTAATSAITHLPVPPAPEPLQVAPGVILPPHPAQCPICFKSRQTATVLTTSGYVFCYGCAYDYVEQYGKCPVTHLPTTVLQLVRLYPNG
jgi:hypothetical protein